MRNLLISGVVLLLVFGTLSLSAADKKSHIKAAEDLLKAMRVEKTFEASIEQTLDMQIQQNPQLESFKDVMLEFFSKYMSWDSMKDDMAKIYAEEFTEKELRELAVFYKTPIGQKAIQKIPVLMAKGSQLGAMRVQENLHELEKMIEKKAEELK